MATTAATRDAHLGQAVCEFVRIKSSLACASARSCPTSVRRMRVSSRQHRIDQLEGLALSTRGSNPRFRTNSRFAKAASHGPEANQRHNPRDADPVVERLLRRRGGGVAACILAKKSSARWLTTPASPVEPAQRDAWLLQITVLQFALVGIDGTLFLEFVVPRIGSRLDVVL